VPAPVGKVRGKNPYLRTVIQYNKNVVQLSNRYLRLNASQQNVCCSEGGGSSIFLRHVDIEQPNDMASLSRGRSYSY
jgi:hypothetical protein